MSLAVADIVHIFWLIKWPNKSKPSVMNDSVALDIFLTRRINVRR